MPQPLDAINVTPEYDRRRKLSDEDKEDIRRDRADGYSMRQLAAKYGVSRRTIQFVVHPERLKAVNYPGHYKKYYDKARHKEYMRKHRAYKKNLINQGKI